MFKEQLIMVLSLEQKTTPVLLLDIQMPIGQGTWKRYVQHLDMYFKLKAAHSVGAARSKHAYPSQQPMPNMQHTVCQLQEAV